MTDEGPYPDTVVAGAEPVARQRAGLTVAVAESRGMTCE